MKQIIETLLTQALTTLKANATIDTEVDVELKIERTKDPLHGDFASNLAMLLAKACRQSPKKLAEELIAAMPAHPAVTRIEVAGPGFINFYLSNQALYAVIGEVLQRGDAFGRSNIGQDKKVLVEFVSANPTGPLHVGHGRGAAFGATLSSMSTTLAVR